MNKTNVFGLPMTVGTREEITQQIEAFDASVNYYVVSRCVDLPECVIAPSIRARNKRTLCEKCGEICWYDTANVGNAGSKPISIVCERCFAKILKDQGKTLADIPAFATKDQVREVQAWAARGA